MKKLLVTGGAGFIGVNFVKYWRRVHPLDSIFVLDALTYAGNLKSFVDLEGDNKFRFIKGDINSTSLVERTLRDEKVDVIVNFAAESHVDRSISAPDAFITTNVLGTHSLLKAARQVWLEEKSVPNHRFHHVSTDEVYGTLAPDDPPFSEEMQYAPNSPYSASKAASDHLVRAYFHTFGLQVTTSNCSNNYGPYHFPEKLIPLVITNILHGDDLPVYGDGKQIRDWLYVEDHARGIEKVLDCGVVGENYNIGGNNEWTNLEIIHFLCNEIDRRMDGNPELRSRYPDSPMANGVSSSSLITHVEDRRGHDRRYAINPDKARDELGFHPRETFETGISKTIDWYLDNSHWWLPLRNSEATNSKMACSEG